MPHGIAVDTEADAAAAGVLLADQPADAAGTAPTPSEVCTRGRLAAAGFGKLVARDGAVVVIIVGTRARRRALAPSTGFVSGKSSRNQ